MAGLTYRDAGVDIDEADRLVERIKRLTKDTHGPEVIGGIGGFGGMFDVSALGMTSPVLVGATDGVTAVIENTADNRSSRT